MPKTVAVIGAGAAGLCAAKLAIREGLEVQVFEQTGQVGGTWVYEEATGTHSSMYEVMKTNLPKELMAFQGAPFREDLPSFMSHQDVLAYLKDYSVGLCIHFHTTVTSVSHDGEKWAVTANGSTQYFDIVFVCNGHYFLPQNPLDVSKFLGKVIHSHDYRKASTYSNQEVTVIGVGPSGIDIALQLAAVCTKVNLIGKKADYEGLPENITQIPERVIRIEENAVVTDSNRLIPTKNIIICTGYLYQFPFFKNNEVNLKHGSMQVSPLYEHVVHVKYPKSLYFIGLNLVAITFPLFEYQVKLAISFAIGAADIPEGIEDWEEEHEKHQLERGLEPKFFHLLMNDQWDYLKRLARIGKFQEWEDMEIMKKMFNYLFQVRKGNVVDYKNINFVLNEDKTDFTIEQL